MLLFTCLEKTPASWVLHPSAPTHVHSSSGLSFTWMGRMTQSLVVPACTEAWTGSGSLTHPRRHLTPFPCQKIATCYRLVVIVTCEAGTAKRAPKCLPKVTAEYGIKYEVDAGMKQAKAVGDQYKLVVSSIITYCLGAHTEQDMRNSVRKLENEERADDRDQHDINLHIRVSRRRCNR